MKSLIDNWDFLTFGLGTMRPFRSYRSAPDPTTVAVGTLIGGSQNVFKSLLGTICNRFGLKRRGPADSTVAGVISSFEWQTSLGATRILRATNGKLQVEYDTGAVITYIDLLSGLSAAQQLFSFAAWWDDSEQKDELIFVNGEQEINMWTGGMGVIASTTSNSITLDDTDFVQRLGFSDTGTLLIGGVEYDYTGAGVLENQVYSQTSTNLDPALSTTVWHGQLFTTSAAGTGIARAVITVRAAGSSAITSRFNAYIYTDNAGQPGTLVGSTTGTIPGAHSSGDFPVTFTFTEIDASPLTNYHLVISLVTSATTFEVLTGNSAGVGTNISSDSGASWSAENGYLYATIYENTVDGDTFTGVTPDPSALTAGTVVVQAVTVSTETSSGNEFANVFGVNFTNDFINVIGNQLYIGCYNARTVWMSDISNYLKFNGSGLRQPGEFNVYILDTNARGATAKAGQTGNVVLFGSQGDSYSIVRTTETLEVSSGVFAYVENETIEKQTSSDLSSPLGQDFIESIGDTIIFLDESNQLRQFGSLKDLHTPVYPILSLDVYTELQTIDFTGGEIRSVSDTTGETVYLVSPVSGVTYIYQIRYQIGEDGNLNAERIWQPPFIIGASRIAVIDGTTYVYSNANPQMYQLWDTDQFSDDSPSDEPIPYESHAIFAYMSGKERYQQIFFDKIYYEGYMTTGTNLYNNVYQEFQGAKNILTVTVNKPTNPGRKVAIFYDSTQAPSLGDVSLGEVPLGEGVTSQSPGQIPKFRAIRTAGATDIFEFALDMFSVDLDSQWQLLTIGVNVQNTPRNAVGIRA